MHGLRLSPPERLLLDCEKLKKYFFFKKTLSSYLGHNTHTHKQTHTHLWVTTFPAGKGKRQFHLVQSLQTGNSYIAGLTSWITHTAGDGWRLCIHTNTTRLKKESVFGCFLFPPLFALQKSAHLRLWWAVSLQLCVHSVRQTRHSKANHYASNETTEPENYKKIGPLTQQSDNDNVKMIYAVKPCSHNSVIYRYFSQCYSPGNFHV